MDGVRILAHRAHQLGRARERALDRRQQQLRSVDVDELRPRPPVLERDDRLVRQEEFVQRRGGVRDHHVDLREQVENVVLGREPQVRALERTVARDRLRARLRMQRHDPIPRLRAHQLANRVVENGRGAPGRRKRRVIQDHRACAHRRGLGGCVLAHERIELRPAGLPHRKELQLRGERLERGGIARPGRAIQIEETANVDVARLAGVEAMKHLGLHAREEVRRVIARGEHGDRIEVAHLAHGLEPELVGFELFAARPVEEPGDTIAARSNRRLQRPQDGERVALRTVQQIVLGHHESSK
jgi:hypothetical protein